MIHGNSLISQDASAKTAYLTHDGTVKDGLVEAGLKSGLGCPNYLDLS